MSYVTTTTATTRPAGNRGLPSRLIAVVVGLAMAAALIVAIAAWSTDDTEPRTPATPSTTVEPEPRNDAPVLERCFQPGRPC